MLCHARQKKKYQSWVQTHSTRTLQSCAVGYIKWDSIDPNFSSYITGLETANLQAAAIISIGEKTNRVLDHFGMADSVIPRLRKLVCTVRSSRWEEVLRSPEWGLTTTQAKSMSKALLADIAQEITKEKVRFHLILYQHVLSRS